VSTLAAGIGGACIGMLVGIFAALLCINNKLHRIAMAIEERTKP
jgi:ABC-type uncharacterized transport system permease subunit